MTDAQARYADVVRDVVTSLIALTDAFEAAKRVMPLDELVAGVMRETPQVDPFLFREVGDMLHSACSGAPVSPMRRVIARLLAEAPAPLPGQTPALDCVVMLASAGHVFRGALSTTPEGTLRLLGPGNDGHKPVLVEQFFSYGSVVSLGVMRDMKTQTSSIISSFETPS